MQQNVPSNEINADMWVAVRVWWAWLWRALLAAIGFGFAVGFILGFVGGFFGISQELRPVLVPFCGIGGLVLGVWILKYALNKKYGDFRIVILRDTDPRGM